MTSPRVTVDLRITSQDDYQQRMNESKYRDDLKASQVQRRPSIPEYKTKHFENWTRIRSTDRPAFSRTFMFISQIPIPIYRSWTSALSVLSRKHLDEGSKLWGELTWTMGQSAVKWNCSRNRVLLYIGAGHSRTNTACRVPHMIKTSLRTKCKDWWLKCNGSIRHVVSSSSDQIIRSNHATSAKLIDQKSMISNAEEWICQGVPSSTNWTANNYQTQI